jgi:hypothetical protein
MNSFKAKTDAPLRIEWDSADSLEYGLREIIKCFPERFADSNKARRVAFRFEKERNGFQIVEREGVRRIHFGRKSDAFRALALVMAAGDYPGGIEEKCSFRTLGVMLDVSRNGVLKVESIERLFVHFALMGINMVQLYMEDVYEIEGEPFFGYARGAYSKAELSAMDQFGDYMGIEVVPCIQTLGHLEQILQWPAYSDLIDVPGVLLVGAEGTYRLIEKMLETVSSCFRTRRINIGMDEAHGIGQGAYRRIHGTCRPFDVLSMHLKKVVELCEKRGLRPMMWSDMYFRIGSATNDYYDRETQIPADVPGNIPAGVELAYWDYYHTNSEFYADWIQRHRALGKEPIFAAGAWTWGRFWAHYPHAFSTIAAGMKAARDASLLEAMICVWGDDGAECAPLSILPAIQYFVESAYFPSVEPAHLAHRFSGSCGGNIGGWLLGSNLDEFSYSGQIGEDYGNFAKWLLWHDPLLNFLEEEIPDGLPSHYDALASRLEQYTGCGGTATEIYWASRLARTLSMKARLHRNVRPLYRQRRTEQLRILISSDIPEILESLKELKELHRTIWYRWYKPFGWDVIERRYAGIISRMESLRRALSEHVNNPHIPVPELEYDARRIFSASEQTGYFTYARVSSPNAT